MKRFYSIFPRDGRKILYGVKRMKTKKVLSIVGISLLVLVLGGMSVYGFLQAERYRRDLQYGYKRSLNDLSDCVGNIETALDKASYANTATEQNGLAAELMRESSLAAASLAALPSDDPELDNVSKFVTQVGDFSMVLSRKISGGQKITQDEYKTMKSLESYSQKLTQDMGNVDLDSTISTKNFSRSMKDTAKDFANFPTLIYDGPFSDNVTHQKPKLTQGKESILQGNAQNIAAGFLNVPQGQLTHTQDTAGNLPCYNFTADGGRVRISVTKQGGFISEISDSRESGEQKLDYEAASQKARAFLQSRGIQDMKESYYIISDGICLINYAYVQDEVVCYPDLVKVGIALDTGGIVRFQATGYIMNHTKRSSSAKLTAEQAQKNVSRSLTVQQSRLALIPTSGLNEVLTYEFLCSGTQKERVLVYINASTGYEENILILQQSDQGILTR